MCNALFLTVVSILVPWHIWVCGSLRSSLVFFVTPAASPLGLQSSFSSRPYSCILTYNYLRAASPQRRGLKGMKSTNMLLRSHLFSSQWQTTAIYLLKTFEDEAYHVGHTVNFVSCISGCKRFCSATCCRRIKHLAMRLFVVVRLGVIVVIIATNNLCAIDANGEPYPMSCEILIYESPFIVVQVVVWDETTVNRKLRIYFLSEQQQEY